MKRPTNLTISNNTTRSPTAFLHNDVRFGSDRRSCHLLQVLQRITIRYCKLSIIKCFVSTHKIQLFSFSSHFCFWYQPVSYSLPCVLLFSSFCFSIWPLMAVPWGVHIHPKSPRQRFEVSPNGKYVVRLVHADRNYYLSVMTTNYWLLSVSVYYCSYVWWRSRSLIDYFGSVFGFQQNEPSTFPSVVQDTLHNDTWLVPSLTDCLLRISLSSILHFDWIYFWFRSSSIAGGKWLASDT